MTWLVAAATAYAGVFVLVYVVSVRTVRGRLISDASLRGAISSSPALRDTVDAVLNVVSIGSLLGAVAVVAVIALIRLDRVRGLVAVGVLGVANGATWLLKEHLLTRPDLGLDEVAPATLNSLPSGHTTAAFSAVAALLLVLPARWRVPVAVMGAVYGTATALATMFAGWHRASDAIASFLIVGICTLVACAVAIRLGGPRSRSRTDVGMHWWVAGTVGALVFGGVLFGTLSVLDPVRESVVGSLVAFSSAALLILGTVLGVMVGILRGLDAMERTPSGAS